MNLIHVVATTQDGVIGVNGDLPWAKSSADMKYFRELTRDKVVIMGVNTIMSLPRPKLNVGEVLPNRYLICSSDSRKEPPHRAVVRAQLLIEDLTRNKLYREIKIPAGYDQHAVIIAGGESIYRETLDDVQVVFRNVVHSKYPVEINDQSKVSFYPLVELNAQFTRVKADFITDETTSILTEIWIRKK